MANKTATQTRSPWGLRLTTLALWALAGASVCYWGLKLSSPAQGTAVVPVGDAPARLPAVEPHMLARLLGATAPATDADAAAAPAPPTTHDRLVLHGVLSGTVSGSGAALIAVGGKPAKPYRAGMTVMPGMVVQSLERRQVRLGPSMQAPTALTLEVARKP